MSKRDYRIRYLIEEWNKPPEQVEDEPIAPGVRCSKTDYGYADNVVIVSIVKCKHGAEDLMFLSSETLAEPTTERLLSLRAAIDAELAGRKS